MYKLSQSTICAVKFSKNRRQFVSQHPLLEGFRNINLIFFHAELNECYKNKWFTIQLSGNLAYLSPPPPDFEKKK